MLQGEAFVKTDFGHHVPQYDKDMNNELGDVRRILARPKYYNKVALDNGKFSDFVTLDSEFYNLVFQVKDRFSGALGFRATTCFRLVLAAPPQVGGLIRCWYNPLDVNGTVENPFNYAYTNNDHTWRGLDFTAFSQLPGAEMNFEDSTALDFKIPFTSFMSFMPLSDSIDFNPVWLGTFGFTDLLPIRYGIGTTEPTITVYTWLEDIEVIGSINPTLSVIQPQAGEPEDVEPDGPLSGPLYKTSKVASLISSHVPSVSSLATPLAWASRLASHAVSAFGYSKPIDNSKTLRQWDTSISFQNNADGPDPCFSMGLLQDNSVKTTNRIGGTDIDEMSIAYLMSKPSAIARFVIEPATTGRVFSLPLSPHAMYRSTSTDSTVVPTLPLDVPLFYRQANLKPGDIVTPSIPFWLGMLFKKYRGTYKFTVKCNKTRFHGGRLMLVYTPSVKTDDDNKILVPGTEDLVGTFDLSQYANSKLWDLRESNTCEFECPWISPTEYLQSFVPYGTFSIHVVDNVTMPDTVFQGLDFMVEVCGDGFDFEHPELNRFFVNPYDDYRSADTRYAIQSQSDDPSELCIGERITSLKQLISRAEYYPAGGFRVRFPSNAFARGAIVPSWYKTTMTMGQDANGDLIGSYLVKNIPYITSAFAFARGGTCFESYGPPGDIYVKQEFVGNANANSQFATGSTLMDYGARTIKIKEPFYSDTIKIPTNPMEEDVVISGVVRYKPPVTLKSLPKTRFYFNEYAKRFITIRAADDAQLGFFIGAPRLMYSGIPGPIDETTPNPITSIGMFGGAGVGNFL